MTDNEVQWEDPPNNKAGGKHGADYLALMTPVMSRPRTWARIATHDESGKASSMASNIRKRIVLIPQGEWETTSRSVGDEEWGVFVRFMGTPNGNGTA